MGIRFERGWSKWFTFASINEAPNEPGAYVIATSNSGLLHRIGGPDSHGLLSIGESDNLRKRLQLFKLCAIGERRRGHNAGWRYRDLGMNAIFPVESLRFRWHPTNTKEEAYAIEGKMLALYAKKHLELPPLNYKYNWSAHR
jgi:hypothetical protein